MKHRLVRLLTLVLVLSVFVTCGSGISSFAEADQEVVTFTFYNGDAHRDRPWNTPIAEKITELTGVKLELDRPTSGDTGTYLSLLLASGNLPDLIYATGIDALFEANAFIPLDDYIENSKYLKDFYGPYLGRLIYSEADPTIYTIGGPPLHNPTWIVDSEMPIQLAVLKEFGYPKVRTIYDVGELLVKYKEKYPEINGRPTYGLSFNTQGWLSGFEVGNPSGFIAGLFDHGEWVIDEDTLDAYVKYFHPGVKEYYAWVNQMWNQGMIDPDCFTHTEDDWKAKVANGQVLALVSPNWIAEEPERSLLAAGMDERTYARMPITLSEDIPSAKRYEFGYSGGWGVGITTSCKDPDKAFEFLDWMASDESLILRGWGIEGEHYEYVDGVRTQFPEVSAARANDPDYENAQGFDWLAAFPEMGNGVVDPTGNFYTAFTTDSIKENYSPAAKEALAAYGVEMWMDLFPGPDTWPPSRVGAAWQIPLDVDSHINDYITTVRDVYMKRMVPEAIMAPTDQFDRLWDEFIQAITDLDSDAAHAEFTGLVKERARMFGTD